MKKQIVLGLGATALLAGALVSAKLLTPAVDTQAAGSASRTYIEVKRLKESFPTATRFWVYSWDDKESGWTEAVEVDDKTVGADNLKKSIIVTWGNDSYAGGWDGKLGQTADIVRSSTNDNAIWVYNYDGWKGAYETHALGTLSVDGSEQLMDLSVEDSNLQHFAKNIDVVANKDILITVDEKQYGYEDLQDECKSLFKAGTGKAFQAKSNSRYEFYWKNSNKKIWAQIDSDIEAENFATDFLNDIACNDGVTAPNVTKWEEYETRYGSMTAGGKGKFTSATANPSGTVVEQAVARYVYIVSKYNTAKVKTYHEYITRGDIVYRGTSANVVENISASNDVATYVSIAAIGTIAAIGAFLFIKKKREN